MVTLEDGSIHTQRKMRTEGNQGSDQTFIVANSLGLETLLVPRFLLQFVKLVNKRLQEVTLCQSKRKFSVDLV